MCNCRYCQLLFNHGADFKSGAGVAVVNYYNLSNGKKVRSILLGKERFGKYKNFYNICSGKKHDLSECFIMTAARELAEEFKIGFAYLNDPHTLYNKFLQHCMSYNGVLNFVIHHGTPVFIFYIQGVSRRKINDIIQSHNSTTLPNYLKEIKRVDWCRLTTIDANQNTIEIIPEYSNYRKQKNYRVYVSGYTRAVCILILNSGLLPIKI